MSTDLRVLIVDDSKEMRRAIRQVIQDLAGDIRECEDGIYAAAAYDAFAPDLVLMDIRMKQMDGLAAIAEIRKVHPEARIVVVTICDGAEMKAAAQAAGAAGYVMKDNLLDLRQILTERPSGRRLQAN